MSGLSEQGFWHKTTASGYQFWKERRRRSGEVFKLKQLQRPHCECRVTICSIQTQWLLMNSFVFAVPARIVNISQDKSVNEGDDVNLFCLAIGRPEPTITWKDLKCTPHLLKPGFHGHLTITSRVITAVTRTIIISICHRNPPSLSPPSL